MERRLQCRLRRTRRCRRSSRKSPSSRCRARSRRHSSSRSSRNALRELAQQQEVLEAQQQESELARIKAAIVLLREQQRSLESALEELNDAELAEDVDDDSREAMAGARRVAEDELATTVAQLAAAEAQLIAAEDARRQALSPPYKEFGNFDD